MSENLKKFLSFLFKWVGFLVIVVLGMYWHVWVFSHQYLYQTVEAAPEAQVVIVLGAQVFRSGQLSVMLQDRADTAVELYRQQKVQKILVSGDHGRQGYDEVNSIRKYLLAQNIPAEDIFLDHAGFDTYDSLYRAKAIFQVQTAIVVTQDFHLPRAVYLGRQLGLSTVGVVADRPAGADQQYRGVSRNYLREVPARVKAFTEVFIGMRPTYLGDQIPITGDGQTSWDTSE